MYICVLLWILKSEIHFEKTHMRNRNHRMKYLMCGFSKKTNQMYQIEHWLLLSLISWYLNKYFEARNLHVTISNLLDCFTVIIPRRSMHACMLSHFSPVWLFMTLWIHNPPGFPVHGILQARILEWVAMPSSRGSSRLRDWTGISCLLH